MPQVTLTQPNWSFGLATNSPAYAIASSDNPRIRVVAGPGTGKSFAMKRRVARLLESGVTPSKILPVTFTRVAAEDLHRELVNMGIPGCENIQGRTLHSLAMRILMRNHVLSATNRNPRPLNQFELKPMLSDLATSQGGIRAVERRLKAFEAAWARLQRDQPGNIASPDDLNFEQTLISWLKFHKAMLIGEAIPLLYSYLAHNPQASERTEYAHILVDEYQDLNKAEQEVISLISESAALCIVGDDDQSIYSFKHAHPEGIREWIVDNSTAADISLSDCRRCPGKVVDMANSLISRNTSHPPQRILAKLAENGDGHVEIIQFNHLNNEVSGIADKIANYIAAGTAPGDILVLAQRGVIGSPLYDELKSRGVAVKSYYAESELESDIVQESYALLKLYVNTDDLVALRWLLGKNVNNWGSPAYSRLRAHCETSGDAIWNALLKLDDGTISLPHMNGLMAQFRAIKDRISQLRSLSSLSAVIDSLFPANSQDCQDLRNIAINILGEGDISPADFLQRLDEEISTPEIPDQVTDVRIMSLHKSKGLSAPVTIIMGCTEGLMPKENPNLTPVEQAAYLEEQRRLFYVGMTRVKASPQSGKIGILIMSYSANMSIREALSAGINPASQRGGMATLLASRFLSEFGASAPNPIQG